MFRASVVAIVLLLTLGQSPALFCQLWCRPQQAGCEHRAPDMSPSLAGRDACSQTAGAAALLNAAQQRAASSPEVHRGTVVPRFQFDVPNAYRLAHHEPGRQTPHGPRPFPPALRI